jgi:hypothetical protein
VTLIEGTSQVRIKKPSARLDTLDWRSIGKELDQQGNATIEQLLSAEECRTIAGLYPKDEIFRSRVVMGRHGFGCGEYKLFQLSAARCSERTPNSGLFPPGSDRQSV